MKWLLRTLIIILVAAGISAVTQWAGSNVATTRNFQGEADGFRQRQPPAESNNDAVAGRPARRERGDQGGGFFGLGVVLRSLIEVCVIVLPFAIYGSVKRRRHVAAAHSKQRGLLDSTCDNARG